MRKKITLLVIMLLIKSSFLFCQVAINLDGSNPNNSAMLDVKSNNKGFLPPRVTHAEMNAIPNPADGLIVYCTDCRQDGKGVLSIFMDGNWNSLNFNCFPPIAPLKAKNIQSANGIVWDWKGVPYATGYKWNTTNDYSTAIQMDTVTTKAETDLACTAAYTRYVWAYNACGNSLPLILNQTTIACNNSAVDLDGNVYKTITIGTQVWMVENLKTTKYRNGDAIPNVTENASWSVLRTGAYCWYNNDAANKDIYGGLYNWFAVADSRNIAPEGWHVPTEAEWAILTDYLGGTSVAGGKLKETGTSHWVAPNTGATNNVGFTALPGSFRGYYDGTFGVEGNFGNWWSATAYNDEHAWHRNIIYGNDDFFRVPNYKRYGFSVRCIRD